MWTSSLTEMQSFFFPRDSKYLPKVGVAIKKPHKTQTTTKTFSFPPHSRSVLSLYNLFDSHLEIVQV